MENYDENKQYTYKQIKYSNKEIQCWKWSLGESYYKSARLAPEKKQEKNTLNINDFDLENFDSTFQQSPDKCHCFDPIKPRNLNCSRKDFSRTQDFDHDTQCIANDRRYRSISDYLSAYVFRTLRYGIDLVFPSRHITCEGDGIYST